MRLFTTESYATALREVRAEQRRLWPQRESISLDWPARPARLKTFATCGPRGGNRRIVSAHSPTEALRITRNTHWRPL